MSASTTKATTARFVTKFADDGVGGIALRHIGQKLRCVWERQQPLR
jgi:hypothetical protein